MDIRLPIMDGYEALKRLKSDPATRHIPVWAVTVFAFASDIQKGKEAGFEEYITKPLKTSDFLEMIKNEVHKKGLQSPSSASDV